MNYPIYFNVQDLNRSEARARILRLMEKFDDPSQKELYLPERSQQSVYDSGRLRMKLPFHLRNVQNKTVSRVTAILTILLELNGNHKTVSKRAIFYKNKEMFVTQTVSDKLIDDLCCFIGATRRSLGITASPRGFVIGSLVIKENGKTYNLQDTEHLGKFICPLMSNFEVIECKAKFILLVEKEAYYASLVEDKIHKKVDCVIITGHGMPDMATRYFLRHLTDQVKIPVLGLFDCDPHGANILCAYTCGSDCSAFDCDNLVTPGIKWLGIRPSDLEKYGLMSDKLKKGDLVLGKLIADDFLSDKTSWRGELEKMLKDEKRCDLDSLDCETLLKKVAHKDWLDNEVQFSSRTQLNGSCYHLEISLRDQKMLKKMLNLTVVKSETATIKIPQLELEIFPNAQFESLSTVQWILLRVANELEERKKVEPGNAKSIAKHILKLNACATGSSPFTFILDDPAGNSFVENPFDPSHDPNFFRLHDQSGDHLGYSIDPTQLDKEAGGAISKGRKVSFIVKEKRDLDRVVKKSDSASVKIQEMNVDLKSVLGDVEMTVKDLVSNIIKDFQSMNIQDRREESMEDVMARFSKILNVEEPWTLIMDDALAKSSIAPACDDIKADPQLTIEEYERQKIFSIQKLFVTQIKPKAFDRPVAGPGPSSSPTTIPVSESEEKWVNLIQKWSSSM